jgi:esterase
MRSEIRTALPSRYVIRESLPTLHFRDSGNGDVACLFVHGFGEGCFVWHDCATEMASLVRVVAVDLRGHGDSEWDGQGRYDVTSYVSDVLAVVSLLRIRRFVFVGHSLGGEIALKVAAQLREKLAALILVDFSPEPDPMGASQILLDFDADSRSFGSRAEYRSRLSQRRPLTDPAMLDQYTNCALSETSDGEFKLKRDPRINKNRGTLPSDANRSRTLWESLSTISCPTLVIRGSASAVVSQVVAERMAMNALPNGQLKVVKMAGHAVMADNPGHFNSVLRHFILPVLRNEID